MKILYLDQNKWIELARGVKSPDNFPSQYAVVETLVREAKAGNIVIPLTFANLYETQKIGNIERRKHLAWVQSTLSQGKVFRGRHERLRVEVTDVLRKVYSLQMHHRERHWFLSNVFFEAQCEAADPRLPPISDRVVEAIEQSPARCMYEYLAGISEETRTIGVGRFSNGAATVLEGIEKRRALVANETMEFRKRAMSARLLIDELDLINSLIIQANIPESDWERLKETACLRVVEDCPTYFIEREIGVRIEALDRRIAENDLRDMQSFCAVLAHADIVVAEKLFSNLATQAGLDKKYGTTIKPDLYSLPALVAAA